MVNGTEHGIGKHFKLRLTILVHTNALEERHESTYPVYPLFLLWVNSVAFVTVFHLRHSIIGDIRHHFLLLLQCSLVKHVVCYLAPPPSHCHGRCHEKGLLGMTSRWYNVSTLYSKVFLCCRYRLLFV